MKNINELLGKELNFETTLELVEKGNFIESAFATLIKSKPSLVDVVSLDQYSFLSPYLSETTLEEDLEKLAKVISEPLPFNSRV